MVDSTNRPHQVTGDLQFSTILLPCTMDYFRGPPYLLTTSFVIHLICRPPRSFAAHLICRPSLLLFTSLADHHFYNLKTPLFGVHLICRPSLLCSISFSDHRLRSITFTSTYFLNHLTCFKHISFRRKGLSTAYSTTTPSPEEVCAKEHDHLITHTHIHAQHIQNNSLT